MTKTEITEYRVLGKLPDVFLMDDGRRADTPELWQQRRQEIYRTAVELQYGTLPPAPEVMEVRLLYKGRESISCLITAGTREKQVSFPIKLLFPESGQAPVIIDGDMSFNYFLQPGWLDAALSRQIGWCLFDRTALAADVKSNGRQGGLYDVYPEYTFGALGAWAWGYSRCVDALEILALDRFDLSMTVFTGHSRGGKTAALAGAADTRAAIVNPNATCAGACGCYRIHMTGKCGDIRGRSETLADLWKNFAFWMGPEMGKYTGDETLLPFDCHFLKALIAPRVLFVSEAAADFWANPAGSLQTTLAAKEVFKLLGAEDSLLWYFREGTHAHTLGDVETLCEIILRKKDPAHPLPASLFRAPFDIPEPVW